MLCQNCGKDEANVSYTQIINGVKKEMHLCENCYHELGLQSLDFNMPIDFSSFLGEFLNGYEQEELFPIITKSNILKCNKCNMSYDEFLNTGKFGCDNCYEAFQEKIQPLLNRIHGSTKYLGRKAKENKLEFIKEETKKEISAQNKIQKLKEQLKQYIQEEKYEEAAKIRDEIKIIENENK